MEEINYRSAVDQLALINDKSISCVELLNAHIDQLNRINPEVNAMVTLCLDSALKEAKKADERIFKGVVPRALEGLPVAIKDLHMTKGLISTEGSRIYKDRIPDYDSLIVSRLKEAGAIVIGKSNTPEFGAGSQTFNDVFGPTLNPYDRTKTCGGSSGGSAVALACRLVAIASGSDLGGSLRNPAAWNNVVGLRPTLGTVPPRESNIPWNTLSTDGPMGKTVEDVFLQMKVISGSDRLTPITFPESFKQDLQKPLSGSLKGLKIAWGGRLNNRPIDTEVFDITENGVKKFIDIGCDVSYDFPNLDDSDQVFQTYRAYKFAIDHINHVADFPDFVKETVKWNTQKGLEMYLIDLARAEVLRKSIWKNMVDFFDRYDYFALPVTSVAPFSINQEYPLKVNGVELDTYIDWMWPCYTISVTGMPAISIPCGFTSDNLPVGIQLIGPANSDAGLLQLAYEYQEATEYWKTTPEMVN